MRIVLVNLVAHRVGGIEIHLQHLAPALGAQGHEIALLHQHPLPVGGEPVVGDVPRWCIAKMGVAGALEALAQWAPDVVYAHQIVASEALGTLQSKWPSLYFAHCYMGVCVSATKCWSWPQPRVCQRTLGLGCLLHYFPHRCGGLNPVKMWRLFVEQRAAQDSLRGFRRIATHSEYVRQEYLRHGFHASKVVKIPFWIPGPAVASASSRLMSPGDPIRVLFLGRFEGVKGGEFLLRALPRVAAQLGRPVEAIIAGDGPRREAWQALARGLSTLHPAVQVNFPGWLGPVARDEAFLRAHVVVVPSVWPEPFGMTGIEAAFHGVPAVAFDVGGIREWLEDGVSGHLARGDRPTAEGLAGALVKTVVDAAHYQSLCQGALAATRRFGSSLHLEALEALFEQCRSDGPRQDNASPR